MTDLPWVQRSPRDHPQQQDHQRKARLDAPHGASVIAETMKIAKSATPEIQRSERMRRTSLPSIGSNSTFAESKLTTAERGDTRSLPIPDRKASNRGGQRQRPAARRKPLVIFNFHNRVPSRALLKRTRRTNS
jgi:hypothetical protein